MTSARARDARWSAASDVLRLLRSRPDITRAALASELGLSSSTATELTARLRDLDLLTEAAAPIQGRGRPTTLLRAHPDGPVVLAADVRADGWTCVIAGIDGARRAFASGPHNVTAGVVVAALTRAIRDAGRQYGHRLTAVSVSVAGTVTGTRVAQASVLGWAEIDLAGLVAGTTAVLILGNDATFAGVAEARRGAARGARTALHLLVDVGIGGALTLGGEPSLGRTGAAGEFGHLPFGDRAVRCPCGAYGCWDMAIDGRALARHLGDPPPANPRAYALDTLARTDSAATRAAAACATALGRGVAGLVNAHDPDVVTLGDLAPLVRSRASEVFGRAYHDGLMRFHRADPPPVMDAAFSDGGLQGAIETALDLVTTPSTLDAWATPRRATR